MGKFNPQFVTRYDDHGADSARFYFSNRSDAQAFAAFHGSEVVESSPATAGGGLWRVMVRYSTGDAPVADKVDGPIPHDAVSSAISLGREMLAEQRVAA